MQWELGPSSPAHNGSFLPLDELCIYEYRYKVPSLRAFRGPASKKLVFVGAPGGPFWSGRGTRRW